MPQMGSIAMMKVSFSLRYADAVIREIVPADHDRKGGAMALILPAKLKAERNPSAINGQRESKRTRLSAEISFRRESVTNRGSQALRRLSYGESHSKPSPHRNTSILRCSISERQHSSPGCRHSTFLPTRSSQALHRRNSRLTCLVQQANFVMQQLATVATAFAGAQQVFASVKRAAAFRATILSRGTTAN